MTFLKICFINIFEHSWCPKIYTSSLVQLVMCIYSLVIILFAFVCFFPFWKGGGGEGVLRASVNSEMSKIVYFKDGAY